MKNLYIRNFVMTSVLVILSFFILGVSFFFLGRAFVLNEKRQDIEVNAKEVAKAAAAFADTSDITGWDFRLILSSISRSTGNLIFITDSSGLILTSSDTDVVSPYIGSQVGEQVMTELYKKGSFRQFTTLSTIYGNRKCYVVALPVEYANSGALFGYVFVCSEYSAIMDAWGASSTIYVVTAVIVLLLAIVLSFITSKRQAEPLNEMAAAARRFAHGDFSARVADEGRRDEIGALTESFNMMAESLEKSEQLRNEFISNVSHELKTPMTTISGFADGILDGTIPPDQQDKYLAAISSETKRLSRMVREMLQMSRIQTVDTQSLLSHSFDLSEVIMRTLLSFEAKIDSRRLDVDAQIPEESIVVRGDADGITQVFYNLMDNAIKFADEGSRLTVSLWKQGGKAYVSVKDMGQEIPADELPFIFDRFHKSDKSRSLDRDGVGLGLSIVKTILNNHNEDVYVTSKNGETEFVFTMKLKSSEK